MGFITGIQCDGCGLEMFFASIEPKWLITDRARKEGWSIGKWHLCPECKKHRRELIKDGTLES